MLTTSFTFGKFGHNASGLLADTFVADGTQSTETITPGAGSAQTTGGSCMSAAEHRKPCESRGSRTVAVLLFGHCRHLDVVAREVPASEGRFLPQIKVFPLRRVFVYGLCLPGHALAQKFHLQIEFELALEAGKIH